MLGVSVFSRESYLASPNWSRTLAERMSMRNGDIAMAAATNESLRLEVAASALSG